MHDIAKRNVSVHCRCMYVVFKEKNIYFHSDFVCETCIQFSVSQRIRYFFVVEEQKCHAIKNLNFESHMQSDRLREKRKAFGR